MQRALLSPTTTKLPMRVRSLTAGIASDDNASPSSHDAHFGYYDVILPKEPHVWGTAHIPPRSVPPHIRRPDYALAGGVEDVHTEKRIALDGEEERVLHRTAKFAAEVLSFAGSLVKEGVTTDEIDAAVHEYIIAHDAYPSPLLYKGYPKSCCTSVNNVIAHGIPDERPLENGDIVNVDITVFKDGFHGDTSRTFLVGDVDEKGCELVQVTEAALQAGIAACAPGRPFKDIGRAISEVIRHKDYCVSTQFTGHGIGDVFHRPPWIWHHRNDEPGVMLPGHCFTIEPCIIQGSDPMACVFPDGWTASTENCARSAQAEHMVLIMEHGADVLTRSDEQ
ncbi:methionine aminopeptidase [Laetiporus sulphureus 93-53]|uniref:Methionine aminopeptidase n=1 Tax=Laetiporus sulphureus 93-53 TaxID=1314785 RepID=A0A165E8L5_9APHY|nr:methionine aminopeptidase [Laetiporus sulphureus 93-53]KZT06471.1 methionine aminopeptidase [Laetiporus sulphureus 93-53]